jgi:hypothetical protein
MFENRLFRLTIKEVKNSTLLSRDYFLGVNGDGIICCGDLKTNFLKALLCF